MTVVEEKEKCTISASAEGAKYLPSFFDKVQVQTVDQFLKVNPFLPDMVVHMAGHDDPIHVGAAYAWGVADASMAPMILIVGKVEEVIKVIRALTTVDIPDMNKEYCVASVEVPSIWDHSDPEEWGVASVTFSWKDSIEEAMQECFSDMEVDERKDSETPIFASFTETPIDAD